MNRKGKVGNTGGNYKYLLGPELSAIVEMARLGFGGTGGEILWGKAGKF